ncbi:type II toxin-antitoxin system RelE/ParE family toxin [Algoriphagus sp.]|uniref:type II toxin-antitoxin system RelE/ParE family toxin n=1 Tax=Algoriphagus sp. TaxID=1872435 RepID=UPI0025F1B412|nr:type II toxin-antitoxin system RelE/ParE family toxin [Algoriphagus sp.]
MVKIKWAKQEIEDVYSIREYYLPLSPKFADKLIDQIFSKETLISTFPESGRIVPELGNKSIREVLFKQFRIIYLIVDLSNICIITVHISSKPLTNISIFE